MTQGKKIKGRKRHITTDILGHLLYVKVHAANLSDTIMGRDVMYQTFRKYSSIKGARGDLGYRGTTKEFVENDLKMKMDISENAQEKSGFNLHKVRWPVERTFGWLGNKRRLAKDYEYLSAISENWIMIAMISTMLTRLF